MGSKHTTAPFVQVERNEEMEESFHYSRDNTSSRSDEENQLEVEISVKSGKDIFGIEGGVKDDKPLNEEAGFDNIDCEKENILKHSVEDLLDLELKELPKHLETAFQEKNSKLPVTMASNFIRRTERKTLLCFEEA